MQLKRVLALLFSVLPGLWLAWLVASPMAQPAQIPSALTVYLSPT